MNTFDIGPGRQWCKACFKGHMYREHDPDAAAEWHALCTGRFGDGVCECPCPKSAVRP